MSALSTLLQKQLDDKERRIIELTQALEAVTDCRYWIDDRGKFCAAWPGKGEGLTSHPIAKAIKAMKGGEK